MVTIAREGTAMRCFMMCLFILCLFLSITSPGLAQAEEKEEISPDSSQVRIVDSSPPLADSEAVPGWSYNSDYIYSLSRTLRDSGLPTAGKVPLFVPSLILDTAFLPISLIAGLLGD